MAEVLSYLEQFARQLNEIGLESFRRRNTSPFLVTLGMAGDLRNSNTSGTSIINIADGVLERGRLAGRVFPVVKARYAPKGPILIGRTAENDIVIPEYSVSRHHCYIIYRRHQPSGYRSGLGQWHLGERDRHRQDEAFPPAGRRDPHPRAALAVVSPPAGNSRITCKRSPHPRSSRGSPGRRYFACSASCLAIILLTRGMAASVCSWPWAASCRRPP